MGRRIPVKDWVMHSSATASGVGTVFAVSDFRNITIEIDTTGTTTGIVKFQGAVGETTVDFSDGVNVNDGTNKNPWTYVQVVDLQDGNPLDGDTGVVYSSATTSIRLIEVNTNSLDWLNVHLTSVTAGVINVRGHASSNM